MPFSIPISLVSSASSTLTFTEDTYIGDLYAYMDSPSQPVEVVINVDNCDVGYIYISNQFNAASTFTVNCLNNGRVIGVGGAGGAGGDDLGGAGTRGKKGFDGGHAIVSDGFNVSVDIDNGYLLGGGGGGGGGGFNDLGATGDPGGGGGGGQGWGTSTGGAAGTPSGFPVASAGGEGNSGAAGGAGEGGAVGTNDGGAGGGWGEAGGYGGWPQPELLNLNSSEPGDGCGGMGGNSGSAFYGTSGAVISFDGAKSEATLRTESRILGETLGKIVLLNSYADDFITGAGSTSITWTFLTDGRLQRNQGGTTFNFTTQWYVGACTGANYQVRFLSDTAGGLGGGWDSGMTADAWNTLSSSASVAISATGARDSAISGFQLRRTGETNIIASGILTARIEWEP